MGITKTEIFSIGNLQILAAVNPDYSNIAYILYPMDILKEWIGEATEKYGVSIIVITNMDWDDDLTPWPATGQPKGCPDFKGKSAEFLKQLTNDVVPEIDRRFSLPHGITRSLVGVSLSGLFTLWQWVLCGMFKNIATLSGSFWYEGFEQWIFRQSFSNKNGKCYMLLGIEEPHTNIPIFRRVGKCTEEIEGYLRRQGVKITYDIVPGNHYQYPIERLDRAFHSIFSG